MSQRVNDGSGDVTTIYHIDPNNHTGYAQVLEEGVDDNDDGKLDPNEIDKSYTLGHDVIAQAVDAATAQFLLYDGHGSTRALLDALAAVVGGNQRFAYDAYGNMLLAGLASYTATADAALTSLLYSGEQTDKTGLQYLRARYYNLTTGRFNRLDPFAGLSIDPLSLHKYLYTHSDPVNAIDPSGQFIFILGLLDTLLANTISSIGRIASIYSTIRVSSFITANLLNATATGYTALRLFQLTPDLAREIRGLASDLVGVLPNFVVNEVRKVGMDISNLPWDIVNGGLKRAVWTSLLLPFPRALAVWGVGATIHFGVDTLTLVLNLMGAMRVAEIASVVLGTPIDIDLSTTGSTKVANKVLNPFSGWEPKNYILRLRHAVASFKQGHPGTVKLWMNLLIKDIERDFGDAIEVRKIGNW